MENNTFTFWDQGLVLLYLGVTEFLYGGSM